MICYDREMPEAARCLTMLGADLIVVPQATAGTCDVPIHRDQLRPGIRERSLHRFGQQGRRAVQGPQHAYWAGRQDSGNWGERRTDPVDCFQFDSVKAVAREGDLRPALPPAGSVRTAYGIELRGLPVPSWGWVQGGKVKHDETAQRRLFLVVSVVAACFKFMLKSLSCRQKHGFAIVGDQ